MLDFFAKVYISCLKSNADNYLNQFCLILIFGLSLHFVHTPKYILDFGIQIPDFLRKHPQS